MTDILVVIGNEYELSQITFSMIFKVNKACLLIKTTQKKEFVSNLSFNPYRELQKLC